LEVIGAISASESKKALSCRGNYQDVVSAPLTNAFDDKTAAMDGEDEEDKTEEDCIFHAVYKVQF
jgi:hypothetical protein